MENTQQDNNRALEQRQAAAKAAILRSARWMYVQRLDDETPSTEEEGP